MLRVCKCGECVTQLRYDIAAAAECLLSLSLPLSLSLSVYAPLSVICSYFGLLILRAETFCKCFHYASHVAKRQRRLKAEATLITLCLSLINFCRIYYLNAFMCVCYACVCMCWCACVWLKGHPKLGQVFGARRHHFKSQLSRTHAKAANTLVTSLCACVCACWTMCHAPCCVCVCVCLPLYARLELFVCVWFGCFNPFRFAINSFCLFTFRLCRQQKS